MRHSKLFALTLLSVTTLSLTACNNTEPATESTIESSVETEETIAESLSATEATETTTPSETTAEKQTEEIHLQEDGTYYVSDELRQKFREYSLFSDWTDEEYAEELQIFLETFYPIDQTPEALLARAEQISKDLEENTAQESVDVSNLMILVTEDGKIACSQELADSIKAAVKSAGLSDTLAGQVLGNYAELTKDKDNSIIYQDIINNIVDNFKKTIEAQEQIQNSNQGNSGDNNSGSSSAGSDFETPENDNPTNDGPLPGETTIGNWGNKEVHGDGGELVGDAVLNP